MKISQVDGFLMSYSFPEPIRLPFWGGERTILKRDGMLIRVKTDSGITGYAPGPAHERAAIQIHDEISPFLADKDPRRWREFQFNGSADAQKTYRAVEIALLDCVARAEKCPISELLGGRVRQDIALYGSAGMYMTPQGYADEAAAIASMGFPGYKMRPALGPEKDLETLELMRKAVGPDTGLMVDAHAWWRMGDKSYSFETVRQLAKAMEAFTPAWLEEPLPPEDHVAYRKLHAETLIPLATGEHEPDEAGFYDLIETRAADVLQMDVCCQGGFDMGKRLFEKLAEHDLQFAFHSWGTHLEVLAAAHLGICWPEKTVRWLEFPCYSNGGKPGMYPFPLAEDILKEPLEIRDGRLVVPQGPGLGISINETVIERYPYRPGPWSFFRIDSPAHTVAVIGDHSVKWVDNK